MSNQTSLQIPVNIEDKLALRRVLTSIVDNIDTILGYRGLARYARIDELNSDATKQLAAMQAQIDTLELRVAELASPVASTTGGATGADASSKLDSIAPGIASAQYGWRDLSPSISAERTGANSPVLTTFRDGIKLYEFPAGVMNEAWAQYHIDHDYAVGTEIFLHVHFAVGNSAAAGDVRWGFEYTIAKGFQQGANSIFAASSTVYVTSTIGANSNYEHHTAEIATGISSVKLEPDSIVLVRCFRDAAHASDTFPDSVWEVTSDIHYQFNRYGTVNKAPDYYA